MPVRKTVAERTPEGSSDGAGRSNEPALRPVRSLRAPGVLIPCVVTVTAIVAWAHWPALSARAISFDDDQYLLNNHLVQAPSLASARRFFGEVSKPSTVTGYYQPLAMTSLMLDAATGGGPNNLRPFHRTSLALHLLNTLLVVGLLYQLFGEPWTAAITGLLFGVHPFTVEPVAWIGERKTLLGACFALLSLMAYVWFTRADNGRGRARYGLCLGAYLLALLSKPTSMPLPIVMLLLDCWPLGRLGRRTVAEKVPFFVLGLLSAVVTVVSQRNAGGISYPGEGGHSLWSLLLIVCHNLMFYLFKVVWPSDVSAYYPFPEPLNLAQPMVLAGVLGTCVLAVLLLVSLRRTRALVVGWLVFFVAIFPAIGVIGFTHAIAADRHTYLPLIGFLVILAWGLGRLWCMKPGVPGLSFSLRVLTCVAAVALICSEARATRYHLGFWRDSETLYRYMLSLAPKAPAVHLNLGVALVDEGKTEEAIACYRRALELQPGLPEASISLAGALTDQGGHLDEVVALYRSALQEKPDSAEAHNNLGFVLLGQGQIDEAIAHCRRALELKPEYADAHNNLGLALAARGQTDQAVSHYRRALELKPDHMKAENNLAIALINQGHVDEAVAAFRRALKLKPDSAEAHNNLGLALKEQRRSGEAMEHFEEALRLRPDYADGHVNMAVVLAAGGNLDPAIEHYRIALRIQPLDADSHCSLGELLERRGRLGDAVAEYREALRINPRHQVAAGRLAAAVSSAPAVAVPGGR
jgi:protein O-mannosyl-transferase